MKVLFKEDEVRPLSLRRLEAEQSNSPEPRLSDGGHPAVLRRSVRTQHILMSCYGRGRCHFILFLFAKLHLIISDANPTCTIPEVVCAAKAAAKSGACT